MPFEGTPGPLNAITDVAGIEVGHHTIIRGDGELVVGEGPVRTGVTAVLPRGRASRGRVFAAWFTLNGNGEMTGTTWLRDRGILEGAVMITNTHSVGAVHEATIAWAQANLDAPDWSLPVVAETWDGFLNDINGFHVRQEHVFAALDSARGGPVAEGSVGGGTGMRTFGFKAGIGTSSRIVEAGGDEYTIGVLVQSNFGSRNLMTVAGVPVGREIPDLTPERGPFDMGATRRARTSTTVTGVTVRSSSSRRRMRRSSPTSSTASSGAPRWRSARSAASPRTAPATSSSPSRPPTRRPPTTRAASPRSKTSRTTTSIPFSRATWPARRRVVQATEEAIVNALVAGRDMVGANGRRIYGLPHDRLRDILRRYNRLAEPE